ncbi:MAG TPA: glycine--tRNA ligase subunit beta [Candidatus Krumholzibacteria bacterium]|nr:glycine--tRNA ligase subunit beta [Candidatus Krumholzibacteria bacterium]
MTDIAARLPFLLEVGTDELPARFQPVEIDHVQRGVAALLAEAELAHEGLRVLASPRRLAVRIDALQVRQADRVVELKGPPLQVCYDADGNPTKAAEGFARKNDVDLAQAFEVEDEKGGRFLGARKTVPGRPAAEVLAEALPALLLGIPFPKVMRWGTADTEYARPVQWVAALLGDAVVPVAVAGVPAGRTTRGHRTLADSRRVELASAEAYEDALRGVGVIVDQQERRAVIEAGIAALVADLPGGIWIRDDELMTEVVHLCEHPTPFVGGFEESYFALPDEVIVTALKAHQRYFAVGREGGGLLPCFLAVRDGDGTALANVRHGNERVLRARLSDALFYWRFDQKQTPDQHTAGLDSVTWLEGYGSVGEKVRRAAALAGWLWENGLGEGGALPADLARAAVIARFDLVTEMIKDGKEFTKLEGIIAARYAAEAGESAGVCRILEEFHRPRSAADGLPAVREAAVLSAAERSDTLAGCWLAGFAPTGAKDPYALRRHALALLRILLDAQASVDLEALFTRAAAGYAHLADAGRREAAVAELLDFVRTRLEGALTAGGLSLESVRATLPLHAADPTAARGWAEALDGFREQEDFLLLAQGFKRCSNILEGEVLPASALGACRERWRSGENAGAFADLPEAEERALRDSILEAAPHLEADLAAGRRTEVFRRLSALGPAIDAFFDAVRVNAEDPDLRDRRRRFLGEVQGLFAGFADFGAVAPADHLTG